MEQLTQPPTKPESWCGTTQMGMTKKANKKANKSSNEIDDFLRGLKEENKSSNEIADLSVRETRRASSNDAA